MRRPRRTVTPRAVALLIVSPHTVERAAPMESILERITRLPQLQQDQVLSLLDLVLDLAEQAAQLPTSDSLPLLSAAAMPD